MNLRYFFLSATLSVASVFLFLHCSSELSVTEKSQKSDTDVNTNSVQEFTGTAGTYEYTGCDTSAYPDLSVAPDIDKDGVIDICDNFIVQRSDNSYMYADEGFYFGYKVWGNSTSNPSHPSEATFTIHNKQTTTMTVAASTTGTNASNFVIKEGISASLAAGASDTFTLKIQATDMNQKSGSIHLVINGKNYYLNLSGNTLICHGNSLFCERRYNQVSFPATHNAHANETDWDSLIDFVAVNQADGIIGQLNNGIRGLMLDTYNDSGYKYCHGTCTIGYTRIVSMDIQIANWMYSHPTDIVTFILEDNLNLAQNQDALTQGGLWNYVFSWSSYLGTTNAPGGSMQPWPYLGWMVEHDKRLVIITSKNTSNNDWYLHESSYGWQNEYDDASMHCGVGGVDETGAGSNSRGVSNQPNYVFVMNHFKTSTFPAFGGGDQGWSQTNNAFTPLYNHASKCWKTMPVTNPHKIIPNHLTVDWYNLPNRSQIINVVKQLNLDWPAP